MMNYDDSDITAEEISILTDIALFFETKTILDTLDAMITFTHELALQHQRTKNFVWVGHKGMICND